MILSTDKAPKWPGLYWCRVRRGGQYHGSLSDPTPIKVFQVGGLLHVSRTTFGKSNECCLAYTMERKWLWGDKIEIPEVAPPSGDREGAV